MLYFCIFFMFRFKYASQTERGVDCTVADNMATWTIIIDIIQILRAVTDVMDTLIFTLSAMLGVQIPIAM